MTSLPSTPHHYITKGLLRAVPFTLYIMSSHQEKIVRHTKRQKTQFEDTEQASEPGMAGILELSDCEFKTTMINILRLICLKVQSRMQEQMGNEREMEILRKT